MAAACAAADDRETLDRWMAEGFWVLDTQLERYLPPALPADLVDDLKEHFMLLATWFFTGQCPFASPKQLERELVLIVELARAAEPPC